MSKPKVKIVAYEPTGRIFQKTGEENMARGMEKMLAEDWRCQSQQDHFGIFGRYYIVTYVKDG